MRTGGQTPFSCDISRSPTGRLPLFIHHLPAGDHLRRICGRTIVEDCFHPEIFAAAGLSARDPMFDNLMASWRDILVWA